MTSNDLQKQFASALQTICERLCLRTVWKGEHYLWLEPKSGSNRAKVCIEFTHGYWHAYAGRSSASRTEAQMSIINHLVFKGNHILRLEKADVYAIRATMTPEPWERSAKTRAATSQTFPGREAE